MLVLFIVTIVTITVGTILGLRFNVFVLAPAMLFFGLGISAAGMLGHYDARSILLGVAACLALLQIGYFAGCFLSALRILSVFHPNADNRGHLPTPDRGRVNPNQ